MRYFGKTDVGLQRVDNQDSYKCFDYAGASVCVLCDGMGGVTYGKLAADLAITSFYNRFTELSAAYIKNPYAYSLSLSNIIKNSVLFANEEVYNKSFEMSQPREMGTTLVCAVFYEGTLYVANVGDSRLYEYENSTLTKLTKDHSYVQLLIDIGKITTGEAEMYDNGAITRAIGLDKDLDVDTYVIDADDDSVYLLCSDGLYNMIGDKGIESGLALIAEGTDVSDALDSMFEDALKAGGVDNITAVIIAK
jgi:protein phosphatase